MTPRRRYQDSGESQVRLSQRACKEPASGFSNSQAPGAMPQVLGVMPVEAKVATDATAKSGAKRS